jgi:YhcH/YjgK/YiaL family protein
MIVDRIENAGWYHGLGSRLTAALEFLRATDLSALTPGRHEIGGDEVYALAMSYRTKPAAEGSWEAHRRYLDVQYVVEGVERMGYAPISELKTTQPYDAKADCVRLAGEGSFLTVQPGTFVLFGPADAHMPGVAVTAPAAVRKVVVKVRVE